MIRRLAAEAIGSAFLLAIVVGSGIMAQRLSAGNEALALLANTLATGAGLVVLVGTLGPVSGAHLNPAVTLLFLLRRQMAPAAAAAYVAVQLAGAVIGVCLAHAMFTEPLLQISTRPRDGIALGLAEAVATFGLAGTILGTRRWSPASTPMAVGLYITAAYWFTASTSFANPAVTLARSLSDTFTGIQPGSVPMFLGGQLAGTLAASAFFPWLYRTDPET